MLKPPSVSERVVATWALVGIIITGPVNLFYKFALASGYVQGLLVDYILPKFYLSDIFLLAFLLWTAYCFRATLVHKLGSFKITPFSSIVFLLMGALVLRQLWSPYPLASFWYIIKVAEMIAFGLALVVWRQLLNLKIIWWALIGNLLLQAIVGLYQFLAQQPLLPYWVLGETRLDSYIGIAQAGFGGIIKILPYGTTAHPNVLAGVIAFHLWLTWLIKPAKKTWSTLVWLLVLLPSLVLLYLTQSASAWLALALSFGLIFVRQYGPELKPLPSKVLVGLGLILLPIGIHVALTWFPSNTSFLRRDYLNQTALKEWSQQPVWGTGLNTMAAINEKYVGPSEITRFAQPTHHIFLLWLAETGLIGTGLLALFLIRQHWQLDWWILLGWVPIMALDHYFLSLQSGLLLFTFIVQYCWRPSKKQ